MKYLKTWVPITVLIIGLGMSPLSMQAQAEGDAQVAEGAKVLVEFTITVPEAKLVIPKNVSQFVPGQHQMIPSLEKALTGMKPGEEKRVDLAENEAFGPYDETKKMTIRRDQLPSNAKPGTVLKTGDGIPFIVIDVSDNTAVVDFNHPLAGKHLVFDVKILRVEPQPEGVSSRMISLETKKG
ncbi:MAG TPA: FKBP-type peptidyl-prolyl cis-trans isomerase [Nitrospiraceae bacterium]|nr:FKBP-type peptidyl-prolyl cis-trans isomerase [Nitrospiraceae bacterium]